MLIHLGRGVSVHGEDVILLTDLQAGTAPDAAQLMARHRAAGRLRTLGPDPKTMVLCRDPRQRGKTVCYMSCVGLRTLRARAEESARGFSAPQTDED